VRVCLCPLGRLLGAWGRLSACPFVPSCRPSRTHKGRLCGASAGGTVIVWAGSPSVGRPFSIMRKSRQIIALIMGVIGAALIVRGLWGGVWPLSVQFIAGVFLEVLAVLRWRYTI